MADVSSVTNHFPTHKEGFVTTLSSTISSGATTVPLTSTSGLTNGDIFVGLVKPGESGEQCFTGTVDTSGSQITGVKWTTGSNADHTAGSTVVDYVTSTSQNMQSKGILVEHNQDGTHSDITATSITTDSLTITGASDAEGWSALGNTLEYTSNDGNKQATYTITGVDKTGTIQEGMKIKLPRTTAVGTQCTDLEASSSQYASKSSPSGITFTDDYTCGAWVKLESYINSGIISRRDSDIAGWSLGCSNEGTLSIQSLRIASNNRLAYSQPTIPLNEWVYVTATVDLSGSSIVMYIHGASVDSTVTTNGTITALVQPSTPLSVGNRDDDNDTLFDGKIKHAFVANKVLSEAEVKEAMLSDDLTTASFSANLVGYFKLEGDFTDSSANGNDLTASGGAVATDADSPFSSTEYGIITSATFSTDTTVEIDFGDKVPVNEDVTAPAYSTHNVPYGFPIDTTEALREQQGASGVVAFSAYGSGATTLANVAFTTITYDTEDYDLGGNFASNTFTAPYNGVYKFTATNGVDSINDGKIVVVAFLVNSTLYRLGWSLTSTTSTDRHCHTIARDFKLNAGDTVVVQVYHNYGSNRSSVSGETYSNFSGHLVART